MAVIYGLLLNEYAEQEIMGAASRDTRKGLLNR